MNNDFNENYQYDSCVSRGICSINPRTSALQTVLVLYLRLFAKFSMGIKLDNEDKDFILNTISITIYNPEFNEKSFFFAVENFRKKLPQIMDNFYKLNNEQNMNIEKDKALELFKESSNIISAIQFGERAFNRAIKTIPIEIQDLYNIMLVIAKSISINLLDLQSFNKEDEKSFSTIIKLLSYINLEEKNIDNLKQEIYNSTKINIKLMEKLRKAQEERYGEQEINEVSYSTTPNKATLVVGSNIRELETILESLKEENIDVYTHDDMMLAHTFPKFKEYKNLKGQFGQGLENCLLDFATFPGPIILTKHSLHNIENFYRGRLFTTDYTTSPKGIIKIEDNNFSKLIESAEKAKGFKTGKQCESITIGFDYEKTKSIIKEKLDSKQYNKIFIIGLNSFSIEQNVYFEKLIKLAPNNILIISFSYNMEKDNLIHINTCFDNYSWIRIFEFSNKFNLPTTIFVPKCDKDTISQIIYLSSIQKTQIYMGKCTPILLNPSLLNTLQTVFKINSITTSKKDLEHILEDK